MPRLRSSGWLTSLTLVWMLANTASVAAAPMFVGPSPYLSFSNSPFSGGSFSYFHLENFEDGVLNTPGAAGSPGNVTGPHMFADSVDADDGVIDGNGSLGRSWFSLAAETTFTFSAAVLGAFPTHVGIVWTDLGNNGLVSFEAFGPNGSSLGVIGPVFFGTDLTTGQTDEDRFFGVIDPNGISRIVLRPEIAFGSEFDHLQYGRAVTPAASPVPEPGSLTVFGVGGLIGGFVAWRRSRPGRSRESRGGASG